MRKLEIDDKEYILQYFVSPLVVKEDLVCAGILVRMLCEGVVLKNWDLHVERIFLISITKTYFVILHLSIFNLFKMIMI